jgi:hypothetical protein
VSDPYPLYARPVRIPSILPHFASYKGKKGWNAIIHSSLTDWSCILDEAVCGEKT